jgi:dipeptidyl aminopeptidase/acylaminoacyl peptidase
VKKLAGILAALVLVPLASGASAPRILPYQDAWPIWSPDGTKIAFTRILRPSFMQLEVVDVRTHSITHIGQSSFQLQPSWSLDGTKLAYQAGGSVFVADLQGLKRRIGGGGAPAFGPVLARTKGTQLIVGGAAWAEHVIGRPAWSSDGKTLAFRRDEGIYTTDGPAGDRLLVGAANPGDPAWSPDGAQLAFTIRDEVWVASRGLVPAHAIARSKPDASTPSWARDGASVVYTWRGGLTRTALTGRSVLLHPAAGLGAAFSPVSDAIAWAGPRHICPGHISILIQAPLAGSCDVSGTPGPDVIEGSARENDVILAGGGNDLVHANDGHTDRVNCGPGRDVVWADRTDRLTRCEVIHRRLR